MIKNDDFDKYKYSEYGIGFDTKGILTGGFGKNVVIFWLNISSYVHADNKQKDILNLGEDPTQGLDNTTLTAEINFSINYSVTRKKIWFNLEI